MQTRTTRLSYTLQKRRSKIKASNFFLKVLITLIFLAPLGIMYVPYEKHMNNLVYEGETILTKDEALFIITEYDFGKVDFKLCSIENDSTNVCLKYNFRSRDNILGVNEGHREALSTTELIFTIIFSFVLLGGLESILLHIIWFGKENEQY